MNNIKLILSDIDGTILPYGQTVVNERTRAAFHAAQAAGIHVGPASGRGFSHIPSSFAGDASCCATCLAVNGMQVFLDGKLIHREVIPYEVLVQIDAVLQELPHAGILCFEDGKPLVVREGIEILARVFPVYAKEGVYVDAIPAHDCEKANVFVDGDLAATQEVLDLLSSRVDAVDYNLPLAGFINLCPKGWSKASGIDVLCDSLDIGLDQVVVFGDASNDIEMLAHVPHSVTVAGAVAEAAKVARHHIGPCEDDSVAAVIEVLAAGEWPF